MAAYSLANCCAQVFAEWRTAKHPAADDANARQFLREQAVRGLRYLWHTGDVDQRTTVACRVAVWMKHQDVAGLHNRIAAREKAREL